MDSFWKKNGIRYNRRTIEMTTYEYDEGRMVVAGCLTDHRLQVFHLATGEKRSPSVLHQVIINLLVSKVTLEIEDVHAEMLAAPRDECLETINSLEAIKGLRIASGFTSKVRSLIGKGKGCNHLVDLLLSMGPSTIQGFYAFKLREPPKYLSGILDKIVDRCWTWRSEGTLLSIIRGNRKMI